MTERKKRPSAAHFHVDADTMANLSRIRSKFVGNEIAIRDSDLLRSVMHFFTDKLVNDPDNQFTVTAIPIPEAATPNIASRISFYVKPIKQEMVISGAPVVIPEVPVVIPEVKAPITALLTTQPDAIYINDVELESHSKMESYDMIPCEISLSKIMLEDMETVAKGLKRGGKPARNNMEVLKTALEVAAETARG